ncbi:MAG: hypothetical protein LBR64_09560 [Dysgonamonadaceae bacterium]|jgi:hypothetical protein|nr:hypothetical protein [Dysgonamonadaceae bacterium]
MSDKPYKSSESAVSKVAEPSVAYRTSPFPVEEEELPNLDWNPNHPVHATQEEWWDHIHEIEAGLFIPWEEAQREFEEWKAEYLKKKGYSVNLAR